MLNICNSNIPFFTPILQQKSHHSCRFAEVLKEFTAAESCADALAKALAESEAEMSSAILVRSFELVWTRLNGFSIFILLKLCLFVIL